MERGEMDDLSFELKSTSLDDQVPTQGRLFSPSPSCSCDDSGEFMTKTDEILRFSDKGHYLGNLRALQKYVVEYGLPDSLPFGGDSLRSKVWKVLLGVPLTFEVDEYLQKLSESAFDSKIRDDTFRTFKKNEEFWRRINEDMLLRVLNAAAADHGYIQGMNVILGPFLLVMPELDSYYCFTSLLSHHIPTYITKNLSGVHRGSVLASKCMAVVDKKLYDHIILKLKDFSVFSIRYILTLMANVQPLGEVIRLWDAIFAVGAHFGILAFCAYLVQLRERILAESSSYGVSCIIQQGILDSKSLIELALSFVPQLPRDLVDELVLHPLQDN